MIPSRTSGRIVSNFDLAPRISSGDYWAEKGEHGRWVRIQVEPQSDRFDPWMAPKEPGRKTRPRAMRRTQGTFESGENFNDEDEWQLEKSEKTRLDIFDELRTRWIGKTIFLVDRKYSREYGTDRRRQRTTAANQPTNQPTNQPIWCEHFILPDSDSDVSRRTLTSQGEISSVLRARFETWD